MNTSHAKKTHPRPDQSGFTLVELLIAMAFFSFILVFFSFGFIQINRTFQKGATVKKVTETGRSVVEDISRNVRLSSPSYTLYRKGIAGSAVNRLCLSNGTRYAWNTAAEIKAGSVDTLTDGEVFNLVKSRSGACLDPLSDSSGLVVASDDTETLGVSSLLPDGVQVQSLSFPINNVDIPGSTFNGLGIDVTLATRDDVGDLINAGNECNGFAKLGDQFCDTVRFATTVTFRAVR